MSITLTGTGGLFTRIGRMGGLLNNVLGLIGSTAPSPSSAWGASGPTISALATNVDNIRDQFVSSRTDLIEGLYSVRDSYRGAHSAILTDMQQRAQATVIAMADDDVLLTTKDLTSALKELIDQMATAVASVPKPTCSASVAADGDNNGDGVVVASVIGPLGVQRDYVIDEDIDVICSSDSQEGGTEGQEQFDVKADASQDDTLAFDWPKGSGAATSLTAIDAGQDASGNLLTNSDFETITSNIPDNFSVLVGSGGSTILDSGSSDAYEGSHGLEFVGTGAELTSIAQTFNQSSGGTTSILKPSTVYSINGWFKRSAGAAAGVLDVELVDGNNTVITDEAGTANRLRLTIVSDLTTSFVAKNAFFRTPKVLPSTIKLRIRLSTALTSAESVFIDHVAMAEATEAYTGGPYLQAFSGATKFVKEDKFVATISNDYSSDWQKLLDRIFGMRALGLQIPSHASPTIADSLIA